MSAWLARRLRRDRLAWDGAAGSLLGAAFLLLWAGIIAAGRWIAYLEDL